MAQDAWGVSWGGAGVLQGIWGVSWAFPGPGPDTFPVYGPPFITLVSPLTTTITRTTRLKRDVTLYSDVDERE